MLIPKPLIRYFQTLIITNAGVTDQRKALSLTTGISFWVWSCMCIGSPLVDRVGRKRIFCKSFPLVPHSVRLLVDCFSGRHFDHDDLFGRNGRLGLRIREHRPRILRHWSDPDVVHFHGFDGGFMVRPFFSPGQKTPLFSCLYLTYHPRISRLLLAFVYPPEILKFSQRAKGVAASQAIGYGFSCMNQYTLPIAIAKISWRYYAIVGGWNVLIIALMWWLFIETKGRTLEEIDEIFEGVLHTTVAMGVKGLDGDGQEPGRAPVVLDATRVTTIEEDVLPDKLRKV